MITKGTMMKELKQVGIRRNDEGKRLNEIKTHEVIKMYYDTFGGFLTILKNYDTVNI